MKLLSRKFLLALSGVISGIVIICSGETVTGIGAVLTSVLTYIITEGIIDAKAVHSAIETLEAVGEEVKKAGFCDEE